MGTERPRQLVQTSFESDVKPFFGNKSPTELCKELDDAVWSLNSTIGKPYVDSFDYSGVGNLERFLAENKDDPNLKFVLNLKRGESASTVLHYVADWNAEAVDLLLKAGADPNIRDGNGKSAIECVIDSAYRDYTNIKDYVYIIELLVNAGADPNARGQNGKSAIECVIDSAHEDWANIYYYPYIIESLIKAGADPNAQSFGKTVLELVIDATDYSNKDQCIKVAKLLIKKGADVNLRDELFGRTLLHHAAANGRENIVELLLQSTEDKQRTQLLNVQDDNGNTPLHCAVENAGYSNVVELLLAHGADYKIVNKRSLLSHIKGEDTPLHVASQKSDRRNIEPFFGKVDINVKNGDGATPLLIASRFGSPLIIESFLKNGADAHAKDKHDNTALHYAANHEHTDDEEKCNQLFDESNKYRPEYDNEVEDNAKIIQSLIQSITEKIIQSLIKEGVNVDDEIKKDVINDVINDKNEYGHTPLFFAVEHGKYSNIKLFLENGADVNIADENGFTVFHFAIRQKELHALKTLLPKIIAEDKYGSSQELINVEEAKKLLSVTDNEGNTLLHHAIKWGCRKEILDLLVEYGVNINQKNNHGIAPIHIAAKYGNLSQIKFFIEKKADLNVQCDIISSSVIGNIGRENELSCDADYINIQDNTVNVNNTEHTNATPLSILTEDSNSSNVSRFLSAKPSIEDSRNWLPLHIAIKRASDEGCTEEDRKERFEIVRSLASVSHVESLMSQGIDKRSEIWKDQFFKEIKNSLTDALEVTDNEKVQKEVAKAFLDLLLQVTQNQEEINRILEDAIEPRNGGKSPSAPVSEEACAPVFDEDFYDLIGSRVKEPTLYQDLADDYMDAWDLQGDHDELEYRNQKRVTREEIENELDKIYTTTTNERAERLNITESGWGQACDVQEASCAKAWGSISRKGINLQINPDNANFEYSESDKAKSVDTKSDEEPITNTNQKAPNTRFSDVSTQKVRVEERSHLEQTKLIKREELKLNKFLYLVSKAQNMLELYKIVDEALKAGVRINYAQGNKDTFANVVLFKACQLKLDPKIASSIVCKLVSKGGVSGEGYNKINDELKKSEIFEEHEVNLQKANKEFCKRINEFQRVIGSAISQGKLNKLNIDHTTFYLEYSEDSVVDVTEVIDGAKSLGESSGGIVKIGENEVEIEVNDGIKNYANFSGNGCVILTLMGLEVTLYHDVHNKDRVIVEVSDNDRKKLDELSDEEKKKVWGKYQLGRMPLGDAIKKGYFERSCSSKLQASEIINLSENVMDKASEIVKNLDSSDITAHSLVNSLVSGVQLSKPCRANSQRG
ncbi:ankyrin repeat domain-containing protein [Wolbachia endosymbiont of Folsomia candida]|uniref:ankyrin repeat domain-containing protein n=1 Tax=Wolbachia endosymbiont of Folsomia candida TaxID=169402 RepID=UPI000A3DED0F|nr:ankyrin repeat domain-containing protein [Wolbachia endosymbiont of Folsomia candida]APR98290.1 hypothetical protein ASM33_03225 [Wolbachia endosymbiont of Folsomia candida]